MKKEIIVPAAGESVTEADIAGWMKSNGDFVELDEALVELETDKASMPLHAEVAGILTITKEDGTVFVGDVIGYITPSDAKPAVKSEAPKVESVVQTQSTPSVSYAAGVPSPAASKIMSEKGLSATEVFGTGKDGRITKEDALKAEKSAPASPAKTIASAPVLPSAAPKGSREVRREGMSRIRRTIANRLVEAQQTAALLTTFNEIDMSGIMDLRKKYKDAFKEKYGVGLGFMSFFTKAVCLALQKYPVINAQVDGDEIVFHDYCDVGIAVATPKGLIVPVVRNAEALSFSQIESAILNYAKKGRDGKITPDDLTGGTFSITNGGVFGSMLSTPIINRPQSAILGMHNIVERPIAVNGEVKIRPIMYVALTYDHRIIDGAEAVRFLVSIKEAIEDPARLLIEL